MVAWKNQTEIRRRDYRTVAAGEGDADDNGDVDAVVGCSHSADCCYRPDLGSCKWLVNLPLCNCCAPDRETWVQRRL